MLLNISWL